jgi:hypothetical protein
VSGTPIPAGVTPGQLGRLLACSLDLWGIDGQSRTGCGHAVRVDLAAGGRFALLPAAPGEQPVRWWILWLEPGSSVDDADVRQRAVRRKPCASVSGVLRTLRETLGVASQARARVGVSPT